MPVPEPKPFHCRALREHDSTRLIVLGELDVCTVPIVEAEIAALRAAGVRRINLDLSSLDFMDCAGLHLILAIDAEARQDGFSIALTPGPPAVQRVFELTNTQLHLPFIDA